MSTDSIILKLILKQEAKINDLEVLLETERAIRTDAIEDLTQELEELRGFNNIPEGEIQYDGHADPNLPTLSIIQQLAKEKDELAKELEKVKEQNIELGITLTQQQVVLVEMITKNKHCELEFGEKLKKMEAQKDATIAELEKEKMELIKKLEKIENDHKEEKTQKELAETQGLIKELRDKLAEMVLTTEKEKAELIGKLKAAEEAKNNESAHNQELSEVDKARRELNIAQIVQRYMNQFSRVKLDDNETPLKEQVRKIAEKEAAQLELGQEVSAWRSKMLAKHNQQGTTQSYYTNYPYYPNAYA